MDVTNFDPNAVAASVWDGSFGAPKKKERSGGLDVPAIVDDELDNLGYPSASRLALLGNLGRENAWNANTIFGGHDDPKNSARNRGLMSWQGDRKTNLENYISQNGGDWTPSESNLRLQARFLDSELRSKYPKIHQTLQNPDVDTPTASRQLRDYIKYVPTAPYNTPDPEFDVVNNREWAQKAAARGLGQFNADKAAQSVWGDSFDANTVAQEVWGQGDTPPIAPESPATIAAQVQSAASPETPRAGVLLNPGEAPDVHDPKWAGFQAFPTKDGRTMMVNLAAAKKLKLKDAAHIADFVLKNENAIPLLVGKVENVTDTSKGPAVLTTLPDGTEATASIVTSPENAQKQAELDQLNHPGSQSQLVDARDVVDRRVAEQEIALDAVPFDVAPTRADVSNLVGHAAPSPDEAVPSPVEVQVVRQKKNADGTWTNYLSDGTKSVVQYRTAADGQGWEATEVNKPEARPKVVKLKAPLADTNAGLVEKGNIDTSNLPKVYNPETGGYSTVWSMSIGTDKGEVLIPRVVDGNILTEEDAVKHYKETGQHLGIFKTAQDANKYAEQLHQEQAKAKTYSADSGTITDIEEPVAARPESVVDASSPDHAVADTIEAKNTREALEKLAPKYGLDVDKILAENPSLNITPTKTGKVDVTYGDLASMGVDINPLIRQKVAEHRIENPTPDLTANPKLAELDAQRLNDTLGPTLAKYVATNLAAGGRTANALAGLLRVIQDLSPTKLESLSQAAHETPYRPEQDIADYLKQIGRSSGTLQEKTGDTSTFAGQAKTLVAEGLGSFADLPRLALMPGGVAAPVLSFATDSALQAASQGEKVDWGKVGHAGKTGAALGAVSMVAPVVGKIGDEVLGTLLNRASSNVIKEGITLGTIGGGTYTASRVMGDKPEDAFKNAVLFSALHALGVAKEKGKEIYNKPIRVKDGTNEAVVEILKDGEVKTLDPATEAEAQIVVPKDFTLDPSAPEYQKPKLTDYLKNPKAALEQRRAAYGAKRNTVDFSSDWNSETNVFDNVEKYVVPPELRPLAEEVQSLERQRNEALTAAYKGEPKRHLTDDEYERISQKPEHIDYTRLTNEWANKSDELHKALKDYGVKPKPPTKPEKLNTSTAPVKEKGLPAHKETQQTSTSETKTDAKTDLQLHKAERSDVPASERGNVRVEASSHIDQLSKAADRLDDDPKYTEQDFAEDVIAIANDTDDARLEKAARKIQQEWDYDRQLKGRGDVDSAYADLRRTVEDVIENPVDKNAPRHLYQTTLAEALKNPFGPESQVRGMHRNNVEYALRNNIPVPPEVLADYPDLTAQPPERSAPTASDAATKGEDNTPKSAVSPTNEVGGKTIYHGTSKEAAKAIEDAGFDLSQAADGTIWFTSDKSQIEKGKVSATGEGSIIERKLDESRLKLGGWDETDKYSTDELIAQGYDGLKLPDTKTGEITYQIFHPEKLDKIVAQPPPKAGEVGEKPNDLAPFANNKIITADRVAEIRKELAKRKGTLTTGIDPQELALYAELGAAHVEAGARKFADFAKRMADEGIALTDGEMRKLYARIRGQHGFEGMEDAEKPLKVSSTKNRIVDEEREARGLAPAMKTAKREFGTVWDDAMGEIDKNPQAQDQLIKELETRPRAVTDTENALLLHRQVDLQNQYDQASDALNKAADEGKPEDIAENRIRLAKLSDDLLRLYNVGKSAGTESGRGLNARKMMLKEDFTLASLERQKRAANGGRPLTDKEFANLQKVADTYKTKNETLEALVKDREERIAQMQTEAGLRDLKNGAHPQSVLNVAEQIVKKLEAKAEQERAKLAKRGNIFMSGIDPVALKSLAHIGAAHIGRIGLDFAKFSEKMIGEFGEKIGPHLKRIFDEAQAVINNLGGDKRVKGLVTKTTTIEGAANRIAQKVKDGEGDEIGPYVQQIAKRFIEKGITDREKLIDTVHNVVKDVAPDMTRRQTMDAISGYGDFRQLSKDEISVKLRDLKGQMQQIGKLEDMAAGNAPAKTGMERRSPTDEERRLIQQVEAKKKEGGYSVTDPETQLKTALAAAKTRLQNQIADLETQIAKKEKIVKTPSVLRYDAEANKLKARRDELKKQFDEVFGKTGLTDEQRLKAWKTRTGNRITELQQRIENEDFSKRVMRPPVPPDVEATALKVEIENLKKDYRMALERDRLKNRTRFERVADFTAKYVRAGMLSSPMSIAKLASAALERSLSVIPEQVVGGAYSKVFPKLAAKATREGGLNVKAEAKALASFFSTGMADSWKILRTSRSDLESVFGKDEIPHTWIEYMGTIHQALKAPAKRAEFERSFEIRAAKLINAGVDVSEPLVQAQIGIDAYKDANRAIFMQDNRLVSAYKRAVNALAARDAEGNVSVSGKAGQTLANIVLPIVKIPANIAIETGNYAVGAPVAALRLAFGKAIKDMSPDEAEVVMRQLKKGTVGTAGLALGYFLPNAFGGYYQPGSSRDERDVKAGNMRMFGVNVPTFLIHNPLLETLQIGATVRRVQDSYFKKSDKATQGPAAGVMAALFGLTEEIPFAKETVELSKLFDPRERSEFIGEFVKSRAVPQFLQFIAAQTDRNKDWDKIKRDPQGILENVETGIPFLRQRVAKDYDTLDKRGVTPEAWIQSDNFKRAKLEKVTKQIAEEKAAGNDTAALTEALRAKADAVIEKGKFTQSDADKVNALLGLTGDDAYKVSDENVTEKEREEADTFKNKQGFLEHLGVIAEALSADPADAFRKWYHGETIRMMKNGTIIVERMPLDASEAVKRKRMAGKEMKLDHTIPLEIGGDNSDENLLLVTKEEWESYTPVENALGKALQEKKVSGAEARRLVSDFKLGTIGTKQIADALGVSEESLKLKATSSGKPKKMSLKMPGLRLR